MQLADPETLPWTTALISAWFEAIGRAHGKGLEPESVPGPIVAHLMEQEAHLLPGCVSGSAGSGFMLGPRGVKGPQAALVALGCWGSWELMQCCGVDEWRRP